MLSVVHGFLSFGLKHRNGLSAAPSLKSCDTPIERSTRDRAADFVALDRSNSPARGPHTSTLLISSKQFSCRQSLRGIERLRPYSATNGGADYPRTIISGRFRKWHYSADLRAEAPHFDSLDQFQLLGKPKTKIKDHLFCGIAARVSPALPGASKPAFLIPSGAETSSRMRPSQLLPVRASPVIPHGASP
jgi:hypothetical protein